MTTIPTPAEFLAQPYDPDEDAEPSVLADFNLTPLESIASSLGELVDMLRRYDQGSSAEAQAYADYDKLEAQLGDVEAERDANQALIDEVLAICKPSTSKLANAIRAVLQPAAPEAEQPAAPPAEDAPVEPTPLVHAAPTGGRAPCGVHYMADASFGVDPTCPECIAAEAAEGATSADPVVQESEPVVEQPTPQQAPPGRAFELGPQATVETWRGYARMFGHTDVDQATIPQLRELLNLPPVEVSEQPHNHDFRTGPTPWSCACGYALPDGAGVPA